MYIHDGDWSQIKNEASALEIALGISENLDECSKYQKSIHAKVKGFLNILINLEDSDLKFYDWNEVDDILPPKDTLVEVMTREFDEPLLATYLSEENKDPVLEMFGYEWTFEDCEPLENNHKILHVLKWRFIRE